MPLDDGAFENAVSTQCSLCKHLARPGNLWACKAFPGSIPDEIIRNAVDHRKPYPGDVGISGDESITFEPMPEARPEQLARLYRYLDKIKPPRPSIPPAVVRHLGLKLP